MAGRSPCPFSGLRPVRYTDVHPKNNGPLDVADGEQHDEEEDWDEDSNVSSMDEWRGRKCKRAPIDLESLELLQFVACNTFLLQLAGELESLIQASTENRSGRKREYTVAAVFLFEFTAALCGGYSAAERVFRNPDHWATLREAVASAHPDRPEWRLPDKPMTRGMHYRFFARCMSDYLLDVLEKRLTAAAVEAATAIGILSSESQNSWTYPQLFMVGDGTFIPAMFKTPYQKATNPDTGRTKRTDPDAGFYQPKKKRKRKSKKKDDNEKQGDEEGETENKIYGAGYSAVLLSARNPMAGNERIVFSAALQPKGEGKEAEATFATSKFLGLIREYRRELGEVRGLAYDMALRSKDSMRILDSGRLPLVKIPFRNDSGPAWRTLGNFEFGTNPKTGAVVERVVYAVNGTPCILVPDGEGTHWYVPLKRVKTEVKKARLRKDGSRGPSRIYGTWKMIDHPLTPRNLRGATVRIRHNTGERTKALSAIPESDAWFKQVYGLREDAESTNSVLKAELRNGRSRAVGNRRVRFIVLMFQLRTIITSLIAHHKRTGASIERWFGHHTMPVWFKPMLKAA